MPKNDSAWIQNSSECTGSSGDLINSPILRFSKDYRNERNKALIGKKTCNVDQFTKILKLQRHRELSALTL